MLCQVQSAENLSDYRHVRRTIAFISETWRDQPPLDEIAAHVGLSSTTCSISSPAGRA
jgi:AraC-like DNA-binding protein